MKYVVLVVVEGQTVIFGTYPTEISAKAGIASLKVLFPQLRNFRIYPLTGVRQLKKMLVVKEKVSGSKPTIRENR